MDVVSSAASLVLLFGVPIPLSIHGFRSSPEDRLSLTRPLRVEILAISPNLENPSLEFVRFGTGVSVATILGKDESMTADLRFTTLNATITLGPFRAMPKGSQCNADISFAAGPILGFQHIFVDEGLNLDTYAWGARLRTSIDVCASNSAPVCLVLDAAADGYAPASDRASYFNQRLGGSTLLSASAGLSYRSKP